MNSDHNSLHEEFVREEEIVLPTTKNFGLTFTIVFALIGATLLYNKSFWGFVLAFAAIVVLLLTYLLPKALKPVNKIWMRLGYLLHRIVSPVILLLLYVVSILPVGLLMKVFGRDPLSRKIDRNAVSYWVHPVPSQSLRDQF